MNKNVVIFLIVFLVLIISSYAQPTYIFRQGDEASLKVLCVNSGSPCNIGASCNFTSEYPNGSLLVDNKELDYNGVYLNYTLPDTSIPGEYNSFIFCNDSGQNGYSSFSFLINDTGEEDSPGLTVMLIILFVFAVFFLGLALFFYLKKSPLTYMFIILTFVFLTLSSYIGYGLSKNIGALFSKIMQTIYISFAWLTVLIILFVLLEVTIGLFKKLGKGRKGNQFDDASFFGR